MKRNGFTLIELLMVISIIVVLVSITSQALSAARNRAKATLCMSNSKQLYLGLASYETENSLFPVSFTDSGAYLTTNPPSGRHIGNHSHDYVGWWWFDFIYEYIGVDSFLEYGDSIIRCPSRRQYSKYRMNILVANYGVNQSIMRSNYHRKKYKEFRGKPLSSGNVSSPSECLLLVDSGYSIINWTHVTDKPPFELTDNRLDTSYLPGLTALNQDKPVNTDIQKADAVLGRHSNKSVNVTYVDGHVENKSATDLYVEEDNGRYINRYPLWSARKR